jgi:hypothetical protein
MNKKKYKLQSAASKSQAEARKKLIGLWNNCPLPADQLLVNLGLYTRSSVLAKILYVTELYENIINIPGSIMEFGVWWGQNLVLFENLRAVYEPYNYTRRVIGFDTFTGYSSITEADGTSELVEKGGYGVAIDYKKYLAQLLDYHEMENTMSHIKKYEIIQGDAIQTVPAYLKKHKETIIALAYFDMALYKPTKICLQAIEPYLVPGSIIALDELNSSELPGETIALKEAWGLKKYAIKRSRYLPDRSYIIIDKL